MRLVGRDGQIALALNLQGQQSFNPALDYRIHTERKLIWLPALFAGFDGVVLILDCSAANPVKGMTRRSAAPGIITGRIVTSSRP
jgi:hypothetical protein